MTVRNIKTREGYEFWDKLCAIPRYGFIHSADNSRIVAAEGVGNWIERHAAQEVVDAAQDEVNGLRAERDQLRAEVEALRLLAGELYQVLGALDAPAGVLDAALAAANGESMEGRSTLLPFVSAEHEALREDAERWKFFGGRLAKQQGLTLSEVEETIDAALAAKEGV